MAARIRIFIFLISAALFPSHADPLSGLTKFWFLNPGVTLTKSGLGLEFSGGRSGLGQGEATVLGGVVRYEPDIHRSEVALEAGLAVFLLEMGISFSDRGSGGFLAPDLCIPIPVSDNHWMAINLFYRFYPSQSDENTFGASLKFAWTR